MVVAQQWTAQPDRSERSRLMVFLIDHGFPRWLELRSRLANVAGIELVSEAWEQADAHEPLVTLAPALVVIAQTADTVSRFLSGVRRASPASRVLIITDDPGPFLDDAEQRPGLAGRLVWRDLEPGVLEAALRAVLAGNVVFSQSAARGRPPARNPDSTALELRQALTDDELEVLRYLCRGMRQKQIAAKVELSGRTVSRMAVRLQRKLSVRSLCQLGAKAAELGLLNETD